jgi:hypothetical protein
MAKRQTVIDPAVQAARAQKLAMVTSVEDKGDFVLIRPANAEELAAHLAAKNRHSAPSRDTATPPQASEEISPARRLFDKFGYDADAAPTEPVTLKAPDGDEVTLYIRRLSVSGFQQFAGWSSRDGEASLNIFDEDSVDAYNASVLFCCIAEDVAGKKPFFAHYGEALTWAKARKKDKEELPTEVFQLIGAAYEVNPKIKPVAADSNDTEKKSGKKPNRSARRDGKRSTGKTAK